MAVLSSPGIGSGLDVQGLVSKLVAAEGQPVQARLDRKEAKLQAQLSAIGALKGALSSFQSALSSLTSLSAFSKRTVTTSSKDYFTATALQTAAAGSYEVEVRSLAQAQKLASQGFADTTTVIGTGTLTFQFGDATKAAQSVTITDGSLEGIRDAVNNADIDVRASIIKGDSGYQLVFSATGSGLDNSLKVSVSEDPASGSDTDMSGLSQLAFDPAAGVGSGKNMTEQVAASDALVYIDGIQVTSSTNTISDAISGVTLNLTKAEIGAKTSLKVATDKSGVTTTLQSFVTAYNTLQGVFKQLGGYNAETEQGGILIGDSALRGVSNQIRTVLSSAVSGLTGGYRALIDLGIKTQADGSLSLDTAKLNKALDNNFDDVGRVFAAAGKPSDALVEYISSTANTKVGEYAINVTQLATKGYYEDIASSAPSSNLGVTSANDTFTLKVDGVTSGTITLGQGTYATAADLAAELQSRINGDSALQDAGVSVVVSYDSGNNRFVFTSNSYGSDSSVEFVSVENAIDSAAIGLTVNGAASTGGQDVAGTIGGVAATGDGQYLTGAGNATGLKLLVRGTATGDRGSVVFSQGVAYQLDALLDKMLDSDSFLSSRSSSLSKQISDIGDERVRLADRMEAIQKRYLLQFSALDSLLGQLQATSNYLSNQLGALPGAYSGSSS